MDCWWRLQRSSRSRSSRSRCCSRRERREGPPERADAAEAEGVAAPVDAPAAALAPPFGVAAAALESAAAADGADVVFGFSAAAREEKVRAACMSCCSARCCCVALTVGWLMHAATLLQGASWSAAAMPLPLTRVCLCTHRIAMRDCMLVMGGRGVRWRSLCSVGRPVEATAWVSGGEREERTVGADVVIHRIERVSCCQPATVWIRLVLPSLPPSSFHPPSACCCCCCRLAL